MTTHDLLPLPFPLRLPLRLPLDRAGAQDEHEDEDEDQTGGAPTGKSKPRRRKTGKGGLARQTTAHGAQLSSTNV